MIRSIIKIKKRTRMVKPRNTNLRKRHDKITILKENVMCNKDITIVKETVDVNFRRDIVSFCRREIIQKENEVNLS